MTERVVANKKNVKFTQQVEYFRRQGLIAIIKSQEIYRKIIEDAEHTEMQNELKQKIENTQKINDQLQLLIVQQCRILDLVYQPENAKIHISEEGLSLFVNEHATCTIVRDQEKQTKSLINENKDNLDGISAFIAEILEKYQILNQLKPSTLDKQQKDKYEQIVHQRNRIENNFLISESSLCDKENEPRCVCDYIVSVEDKIQQLNDENKQLEQQLQTLGDDTEEDKIELQQLEQQCIETDVAKTKYKYIESANKQLQDIVEMSNNELEDQKIKNKEIVLKGQINRLSVTINKQPLIEMQQLIKQLKHLILNTQQLQVQETFEAIPAVQFIKKCDEQYSQIQKYQQKLLQIINKIQSEDQSSSVIQILNASLSDLQKMQQSYSKQSLHEQHQIVLQKENIVNQLNQFQIKDRNSQESDNQIKSLLRQIEDKTQQFDIDSQLKNFIYQQNQIKQEISQIDYNFDSTNQQIKGKADIYVQLVNEKIDQKSDFAKIKLLQQLKFQNTENLFADRRTFEVYQSVQALKYCMKCKKRKSKYVCTANGVMLCDTCRGAGEETIEIPEM